MRKVRVIKCVIRGESVHELYDYHMFPIRFYFYGDSSHGAPFPSVLITRGKDLSKCPVLNRYKHFTEGFMIYHAYERIKERRKHLQRSSGLQVWEGN